MLVYINIDIKNKKEMYHTIVIGGGCLGAAGSNFSPKKTK